MGWLSGWEERFAPMKLSQFSDYSLRVLMYAAVKADAFTLEEVSEAYGISRNHVAKVIQNLAQAGYLETRRGRGGGIRLSVAPEEVRIGKLVRDTEVEPVIVECFDPATNTCRISRSCRLKGVLATATAAFFRTLDEYTLADLVSGAGSEAMRKALNGAE